MSRIAHGRSDVVASYVSPLFPPAIEETSAAEDGGKGYNLTQLVRIPGIRVPDGFIVRTRPYQKFLELNDLLHHVTDLETLIGQYRREGQTDENCKRMALDKAALIRGGIRTGQMPKGLGEAVHLRFQELKKRSSKRCLRVAVRSSATTEDICGISYAGRYVTSLNQSSLADIMESIRACWLSNFNASVVEYNLRVLDAERPAYPEMAVVVQRMVNARVSGVGYNVDPRTGRDAVVFETNYGLGESIVGGEVTPDSFMVDVARERVVEKALGRKSAMTVSDRRGTRTVSVKPAWRERFTLVDTQALEVARSIDTIGQHFKRLGQAEHVDTEFAHDDEGALYFTQWRPEQETGLVEVVNRNAATGTRYEFDGVVASRGCVAGLAVVLHGKTDDPAVIAEAERRVREGNILIVQATNPDWNGVLLRTGGIIVNDGG